MAQNFGLKSQDEAGPVVLNSNHNNKNNLWVLCHWRSRWQATTAAPQLVALRPPAPALARVWMKMRRMILTKAVLAGIPALVEQGLNTEAIAARLGCKVSTLKVRCSQARVSLRVPKEVEVVPLVPALKPPKQKRSYAFALPTTLQLSRVAMSRLRQHAEAIGVNEAQLASDLLEAIAQDDLYDAVLDRTKDAA